MAEVVGIRFKEVGKVYFFSPGAAKLEKGVRVIVETSRGLECGEVVLENHEVTEEEIVQPLKEIVRLATPDDIRRCEANRAKERDAFSICEKKIEAHKLDMKLVDVEYTFDSSKILFYFTADGRVDFRELVKDLAGVFHTRIELRQIGVRDESKMIGGLGICGRELCCCSFLTDFVPVSIKMAKEQSLSMNPAKISGCCGRLMCCLKYEQEAYEDAHARMPRPGHIVMTPQGQGMVEGINLLKETVTVRLDCGGEADLVVLPATDVEIIGGKPGKRCQQGGRGGSQGGGQGGQGGQGGNRAGYNRQRSRSGIPPQL